MNKSQACFCVGNSLATDNEVILVVGRICGGKTEACKLLQAEFDYLHVPCSSILCNILGYPSPYQINRRDLQDAGYSLLHNSGGHGKLAEAIIDYMETNRSKRYVLDGLRFPETSRLIEKHLNIDIPIVYIANKTADLFQRYMIKYKTEIPIQDFLLMLDHPVEHVKGRYQDIADFVICNYSSLNDFLDQIRLIFHGM